MRIYISGQITGLKVAKAVAMFEIAEHDLARRGHKPVNPMTLTHDHDQSWEQFMLVDIAALFKCDAIYMLSNWSESKGAKIEHDIARHCGKKIFYADKEVK